MGLIALGLLIIVQATSDTQSKEIFNALLPVFGTWVGTLLAFYFSKDNFDAATKSVTEMAKTVGNVGKLASPVKDFMIAPDKIITLPTALQGQPDNKIFLRDIVSHLKDKDNPKDRIPLFAENKGSGVAKYLIHLSEIEKYIAGKVLSAASPAVSAGAAATPAGQSAPAAEPAITELTLANLFKDKPESTFKNFTFVKESATLADAQVAMGSMTSTPGVEGNCYDVFVTATGNCKEPVLGWITNDIINNNAKV